MARGSRSWLAAISEVIQAVLADPLLLAPAVLVMLAGLIVAYLAWRFV